MSIRRILVAADYSDSSAAALEVAGAIAGRFNARIEVIHVWDRPSYVPESSPPDAPGAAPHRSISQLIRENAEREMQQFLDRCPVPANVHITHHLESGEPTRKILEASEQGYQLLVLGSHGHSGFRQFLLGSVAERLVRLATIPVLTVPSPDTHAGTPVV